MIVAQTPALVYIGCLAFGAGGGNLISLSAIAVQEDFPADLFTRVIGMIVAGNQFTFAFGPALLGLLRDLSGGYTVPLVGCLALESAAAAIVLLPRSLRYQALP